jgi:hypothetical protein
MEEEDDASEPTRLTARQRSLRYGSDEGEAAPVLDRQRSTLSAIERSEKARQRRMLKERQLEASKQATIDKLLNRQTPRRTRQARDEVDTGESGSELPETVSTPDLSALSNSEDPRLLPPLRSNFSRTLCSQTATTVTFGSAETFDHLFPTASPVAPTAARLCAMPGCGRPRAYAHPRTQTSLCSRLQCYQKVQ